MIVLDTHIWLWWIAGNHRQLKSAWRQKIADADQVGVAIGYAPSARRVRLMG